MNTETLALTDLLNCGTADVDMLDIFYSNLGDSLNLSLQDALDEYGNDGDLNTCLDYAYTVITTAITDRLNELLEDYLKTLNKEGEPTDSTRYTSLQELLESYLYTDEEDENYEYTMLPLSKDQINTIKEKIEEMEESYPYCNYLDSHFQNDLDQTLDSDYGVDENCKKLLEYWLFNV